MYMREHVLHEQLLPGAADCEVLVTQHLHCMLGELLCIAVAAVCCRL